MQLLKFKINPGKELMEVLTKEFEKRNLQDGAIVSVIGAFDECCISCMPKNDPMKDVLTEYYEPVEVNGTGEIKEGKPHIHINLGRENNQTASGHLHWGKVKSWYATVFVVAE